MDGNDNRLHRTTSHDGTPIVVEVHGEGPPLVLVPGGPADGDTGWHALLPHLTDRYSCYGMNTRGRGRSGDHPDHRQERLAEDIASLVDSIGGEVTVFGHSAGGVHALDAAPLASSLGALMLFEPAMLELADDAQTERFVDAFVRVRRAVDAGRAADGAWIFLEEVALANKAELALLAEVGAADDMAPLVPLVLDEVAQSGLPHVSDHASLERIDVPVLLLRGTESHPLYAAAVRYLADRLPDVEVREVAGAGHLGPEIDAGPVAAELVRFGSRTGSVLDQA